MIKVLSIAGSDCSGGAGIQADLKTIMAHGGYGMSVVTALTAQNTTGVYGVVGIEPGFVAQQIDCVFGDIRPDSVKIGMVSDAQIIAAIAERLAYHKAENIVLDPVMASTSGSRLLQEEAIDMLCSRLMPMARVITPNIPEAEVLWGGSIKSKEDMEKAAADISARVGCSVILKGGHGLSDADDLLFEGGRPLWVLGRRIDNPNTHGTGCTLSSSIACNLARGLSLADSLSQAKNYLSGALGDMLDLGAGAGPMNHAFKIGNAEFK